MSYAHWTCSLVMLAAWQLCVAWPAEAQERSVAPGINADYQDADVPHFIKLYESEGRELYDKRDRIVAECRLKAGMAVADIGAGTGLFTRAFSPVVGPGGLVYAVDISQNFVAHILETSRRENLRNVVGHVCRDVSADLPPQSIDVAFVCSTYHHFEFPQKMMQSIHRALRPGGQLVLIDEVRIPNESSQWVLNHVRAGQDEFTAEIVEQGFQLVEEQKFLRDFYFVRFQKATDAASVPRGAFPSGDGPSSGAAAGEVANVETSPGHSLHGEAFDDGPRQAAQLMEGVGNVDFPVTTASLPTQQFMNQGVAQLHGFWYVEAERSFRQAAAVDPRCAMAYWGMSLANVNNKRARQFAAEAVSRKHSATRRERMYIDALSAYVTPGTEVLQRQRDYAEALREIVASYPDDLEAKSLLVAIQWRNSLQNIPLDHEASDRILQQVLEAQPAHPCHHYRIHLWDKKDPQRAMSSALQCGPSAPAIAHMWHMPGGHVFWNLKQYEEAAWYMEASARVDHAYMQRTLVLPDQIFNYVHNSEWLLRALVNTGRVREAVSLAENMIEVPRHPRYNTPGMSGSASYGRLRLLQALAQYELWEELIAAAHSPYLDLDGTTPDQEVTLRQHLTLSYIRKGDTEKGVPLLESLATTLRELIEKRNSAKRESGEDADSAADKAAQRAHAKSFHILKELQGHLAVQAGNFALGCALLEEHSQLDPAALAYAQLSSGNQLQAEQTARELVGRRPNEALPLVHLANVQWASDKRAEARQTVRTLLKLAPHIDRDVPLVQRLDPILRELDADTSGRNDDREQPVDLDALGPLRWRGAEAPQWTLRDAQGRTVSLETYRDRPLVLLFYLGSGCLHCAEQIKAYTAKADQFHDAGISLVAISTDSADELAQALTNYGDQMPFPLLSDPTLSVFRRYRAHDDFERIPLHATFLVDGQGTIRWLDISSDPFNDVDFVLNEARRQLSLDRWKRATAPDKTLPDREGLNVPVIIR